MKVLYYGEEIGYIMTDFFIGAKEALEILGYEKEEIAEMNLSQVDMVRDCDVWQDIVDEEPLTL